MTLEAACADRDQRINGFRQSLEPLRTTLKTQPFVAGEVPNYADYIVSGGLMWARSKRQFKLLTKNDTVALWRARMLDRFEDARNAPGYDT